MSTPNASATPLPLPLVEERWIECEVINEQHRLDHPDDDDGDDSDDIEAFSLFEDPDPMDTFHYQFNVTKTATSSDDTDTDTDTDTHLIDLELTGHKAENGQTLNSTGLTIWRASFQMCDFLVECHNAHQHSNIHLEHLRTQPHGVVSGRSVLELGAGLGLCGILAHKLGSTTTILTDGDTDTLELMRQNVTRNDGTQSCDLAATNGNGSGNGNVHRNTKPDGITCQQLRWANSEDIAKVKHETVTGFDIIMGSDIIYLEEMIDPLLETVVALLKPHRSTSTSTSTTGNEPSYNGGVFLLSYARRNVKFDLVRDRAEETFGLTLCTADTPHTAEGIYVFRRAGMR